LAKAFDCVNHETLLAKLRFYGIQGVSEDWFLPYLTNRRQNVEVESPKTSQHFFSELGILKHGVPQGSNLGSLLLIMYINDRLGINSVLEPISFANDASVVSSSRNFEELCSVTHCT
jgi:hypothetical protein